MQPYRCSEYESFFARLAVLQLVEEEQTRRDTAETAMKAHQEPFQDPLDIIASMEGAVARLRDETKERRAVATRFATAVKDLKQMVRKEVRSS